MPTCPKCSQEMEPGYLLDSGDQASLRVQEWAAGTPEKSWTFGLFVPARSRQPVVTLRCTGCGFLESYAPPPSSETH